MKFAAKSGALQGKPDGIAVALFDDEIKAPRLTGLDKRTVAAVGKLIAASRFEGKVKETVVHFSEGAQAPVLILQGLGKRADFSWKHLRQASGAIARAANANHVKKLALFSTTAFDDDLNAETTARAIVDGVVLGSWSFEHYRPKKKSASQLESVDVYFNSSARQKTASAAMPSAQVISECHNMARDYGTHPANVVTTDYLRDEAKKLSKLGIKVTIVEKDQLRRMGCNLIVAVGGASAMPPRIIIMDWNPRGAQKTFAFVGKGLVFDSGGLNIKVAMMEEMKSDMCGAAAVLAAMYGVGRLKPKHRIIGAIGAAENAIGPSAYRPSDIYTAHNGKTVEIGNTDAEGRLVLADTLSYVADKYKPNLIVDIATLTGAAKVALGSHADAVFANKERVGRQVLAAAERAFEQMWPLPMFEEYVEEVKGDTAMLKNSVGHRWGGACTAAAFLKEFVGDTPWSHIDIAPTSFPAATSSLNPKMTANGSATKTLLELALRG